MLSRKIQYPTSDNLHYGPLTPESLRLNSLCVIADSYIDKQKISYYKRFTGKKGIFLSEKFKKGVTSGFNEYYIPVEVHEKLVENSFYTVNTTYNELKNNLTGNIVSSHEDV